MDDVPDTQLDAPLEPQLPSELVALANLINERTECLASGSQDIQTAALNATKFIFDLGAYLYNTVDHLSHLYWSFSVDI
jgi:hypothetical protein